MEYTTLADETHCDGNLQDALGAGYWAGLMGGKFDTIDLPCQCPVCLRAYRESFGDGEADAAQEDTDG